MRSVVCQAIWAHVCVCLHVFMGMCTCTCTTVKKWIRWKWRSCASRHACALACMCMCVRVCAYVCELQVPETYIATGMSAQQTNNSREFPVQWGFFWASTCYIGQWLSCSCCSEDSTSEISREHFLKGSMCHCLHCMIKCCLSKTWSCNTIGWFCTDTLKQNDDKPLINEDATADGTDEKQLDLENNDPNTVRLAVSCETACLSVKQFFAVMSS